MFGIYFGVFRKFESISLLLELIQTVVPVPGSKTIKGSFLTILFYHNSEYENFRQTAI